MYFGNQFARYQPNLNINNHHQINKEEEEKENEMEYKGGDKIIFALKKNFISKDLINFCENENNKQLDELLSDLVSFKIERKIIFPMNFTQLIFENIEKMIIEISCIRNGEMRYERIQKLYLWYKEKIKTFEDLKKIQEKSYKEKNEIDDLELYNEKELKKDKDKEEIIINEEEKNVKEDLKHRNKDMLYKDMLQDYRRKHIRNKLNSENVTRTNKELESIPIKNEKLMYKTLSSNSFKNYSHSGEMTTFYSTKNGKNAFTLKKNLGFEEQNYHSLFNLYNKNYIPPLNRETKFSYSYNRPKYDYNTMVIEKDIIEKKIKELKEKRTKEEIKEKIDKFGKEKAKYKESIINKYELKNIINMYANSNDFNSNLLQKYKPKTIRIKKNFPKRISQIQESNLYENIYDENIIDNKHESKEKTLKPRNNPKRSYSQVFSHLNFLKEDPKMETNQIKNLDNNTKKILEKEKGEIKVIKIKLKQPREKIKKKYMNLNENYSDIPNDVVYNIFNKNPLFKQKFLYDKICDIKFKKDDGNIKNETENDESESEYHNFYMSAYDFGNLNKIDKFTNTPSNYKKQKKTRNGDIIETFDSNKDNFLNFRKTMNSWKKDNFEKLYNKIKKKENIEQSNYNPESKFISFKKKINLRQRKQNSLLNAMVNPIEESLYPKYFLPRSGSMLLKRKTMNEKKGKSKKKKK